MTDVTVIIPYTPAHDWCVPNAIASAERQTVVTDVLAMEDTDHRGAGWTRNRLLTRVETDYVLFLDADDVLEPDAVAKCRQVITPGHYVYTDWYIAGKRQHAPQRPWCQDGTWHCITSLCHMDDVTRVGGFDEHLEALEDTDFWLKMNVDGICGIHVPYPLFHYGANGQRSRQAKRTGRDKQIKQLLIKRYGGVSVACCGQNAVADTTPQGIKQQGDVLGMALWSGNHVKRGLATGRRYPRMSYPKVCWMSPFDIKKDARSWRLVKTGQEDLNKAQYIGVGGFADAMIEAGVITPPPKPPELGNMPPTYKLLNPQVSETVYQPVLSDRQPDWSALVELGARRYE